MEISFCTAPGSLRKDIGYGAAGFNIVRSLQKLGHTVPYDDRRSPVQINFSQPEWYHLRDDQYTIGYTPWESTIMPPEWPEIMRECDEVWTTSEWCRKVYEDHGLKNIYVYKHGVDPVWSPQKRQRKEVLRFLHVGEPAPRKGGQLAFDAFRAAFGNQKDVHLTIKAFADSTVRLKDRQGNIIGPITEVPNVSIVTNVFEEPDLVRFYKDHDVLIYPSYGEGFGLIPLQALATGMPSVVTQWWCPYSAYTLPLDYKIIDTPWDFMHPGKVSEPDFDNLVYWYQELYKNFNHYASAAFKKSFVLHKEFDWMNLTEKAFDHVIKLF